MRKSPEQRVADLLTAARKQFASKGLAATTILDITEAAGVGKGTFYLYFDSKEHILGALWQEFVDGFVAHTVEVLASSAGMSWLAIAERMVIELVNYDIANVDIHQLVFSSANADALKLFRDANQQILVLLRGGLVQGVADNEFDVANPELTADLLYYAAEGLLNDAMLYGDGSLRRDEILESLLEMVRRTLPPPSAPTKKN